MSHWIFNGIAVAVFIAIGNPIQRAIYSRVEKKWKAYLLTLLALLPLGLLIVCTALFGSDLIGS